jgi:hypothetical protein
MKRKTLSVGLLVIAVVSATVLGGSYVAFVPSANAATEDKIEEAIASGVAWLASQQKNDGSWGDRYQAAVTCFALVNLEERAYDLGYGSPFNPDYPYSNNVIRGWQYIFGVPHAHAQTLGVQSHNGSPDNPDTNGNGYGIYFETWGEEKSPTMSTGICLMALAASRTPNRPNDGRLDYNGDGNPDTFKEIAQETVDWLAFAQADSGRLEGGWGYGALDNASVGADNSVSGYAVLGLAYGQEFGYTVPAWVKTELNVWINHIQCSAGDNHGGSGYGWGPCDEVNELKTGNLIFEMAFVGDAPSVQRFQEALDYIERHWQDSNIDPELGPIGWGYNVYPAHYQAMYTLMKGFRHSGIELIDTDGDGNRDDDWFNQEPPASPPQDFTTALLAQQNADGSWPGNCAYGNSIRCTTWALLTVGNVVPLPPEVRLLAEAEAHQVIQFDPNAALQRRIVDDGFVPNSPEFDVQIRGIQYRAQGAEHLGTGKMRVYYAKVPDWDNVEDVERP